MDRKLLTHLYQVMLGLYPRHFRSEFGDEMVVVFDEILSASSISGPVSLLKVVFTELSTLPIAALQQHLNVTQGSDEDASLRDVDWEGSPSKKEMVVALAVFVLPAINILLQMAPSLSFRLLLWLLVFLFLAVFLAGVLRGFPRWSLPYLGLVLSVASFLFIFQWAADLLAPTLFAKLGHTPQDESTWLLLQAFWSGLMWLSLFTLTFMVLGMLKLLRRFQPLFWRIKHDWTIASYILYSGAMFALLLAFEQYRYREPYAIASTLCLATGAWLYLRSAQQWQRTLALLAGLTLAMGSAVAGQLPVLPLQDWKVWFVWPPPESERWFEARRTILIWGWMVVFILAPGWLRLFSKSEDRSHTGAC